MEQQGTSPVPGKIDNKPPSGVSEQTTVIGRFARRSCAGCDYCHGQGAEMHCRRYPPKVFFDTATGKADVKFPGVLPDWFCGEQRQPSASPSRSGQ